MKRFARRIIVAISWSITASFLKKTKPVVIGVAGSIGKTGTKRAIARVLAADKKVIWQDGNYNDLVSVPLVIFGLHMPSLFNPFAWLGVFGKMLAKFFTLRPEVIVLELGTDGPGQIAEFGRYLKLDYAVVTAIAPEHMEYFGTLEAVAKEELSILDYADAMYISQSVTPFIVNRPPALRSYGRSKENDRWFTVKNKKLYVRGGSAELKITPRLQGEHQYESLVVASELALQLGMAPKKIEQAASQLQSMPGRMNVLEGKNNNLLIDDTYNASPEAVIAALNYLYDLSPKRKIAVLGNMNEMGSHSAVLHTRVGQACDPKKLDMVITIGKDANISLASAAREQGCQVKEFDSPYAIADFLLSQEVKNSAILFKGSQNGVFLEEAIKPLLLRSQDSQQLVRQSASWLKQKKAQFKDAR